MKKIYLATLTFFILFCSFYYASATGDTVRVEARIDQVYQQYGLTGQGVIIAIIDRGIDYRHPDFIDENGNTRIAFIFDMLNDDGKNDPDNIYGVGTIFDEAEINQALSAGGDPISMDWHGHGIATTGIAAGNGSAIASNKYQGVAPKAKIIAVKAFADFFPPFPGSPGQTGFFDPNYLEIALQFVADKADSLGLPSVTLMNLGSIGGPTDGTSKICRAMDAFTGPGRLLVNGVGDDGGGDNRSKGMVAQGNTAVLEIEKGVAGNLRLELWYEGVDRMDILIEKPDGSTFGPYPSPVNNNEIDTKFLSEINYYHRGSDWDFNDSNNGQRQVLIDFTGAVGTYKVSVIGSTVSDGNFHGSLNPSTYSAANKFLTYVATGSSINDYATAFNVITPTDYVVKNTWTDINGVARSITGQGNRGELWIGSSVGPTIDGRLGVDFAAPGEVLFTSYSTETWYSHNAHLVVQDGNGYYGLQNAVSAAAPLSTGVIALMLELNPMLTPVRARQILQNTARADNFTGNTPNAAWGYGKLDALAAVDSVANSLSIFENGELQHDVFDFYPNPCKDVMQYRWKQAIQGPYTLSVLNIHGQEMFRVESSEMNASLDTRSLIAGVYFLRIRTRDRLISGRFIKE